MQVKRRINKFFGSILRKEKAIEDGKEVPTRRDKKSNKKNNQSYSQWDLMEHIGIDTGYDNIQTLRDEKMIYSDGLTLESLEVRNIENEDNLIYLEDNKRKSFLKRGSSLIRRSIRRNKAKKEAVAQEQSQNAISPSSGSLTNIVQEINETLIAVASFGETNASSRPQNLTNHPSFEDILTPVNENMHKDHESEYGYWNDLNKPDLQCENEKKGFRNGLRRQASKLASKFQRSSGSTRLKAVASIDSFPNRGLTRQRSASWSASHRIVDEGHGDAYKRTGSFKRKMSFKKARKTVVKGISSVGKSMAHASAVMPVAYEYPPIVVSYYPDYEADLPTEMEQYYYRTVSYQERHSKRTGHSACHSLHARPTAFYQHGYCYNG